MENLAISLPLSPLHYQSLLVDSLSRATEDAKETSSDATTVTLRLYHSALRPLRNWEKLTQRHCTAAAARWMAIRFRSVRHLGTTTREGFDSTRCAEMEEEEFIEFREYKQRKLQWLTRPMRNWERLARSFLVDREDFWTPFLKGLRLNARMSELLYGDVASIEGQQRRDREVIRYAREYEIHPLALALHVGLSDTDIERAARIYNGRWIDYSLLPIGDGCYVDAALRLLHGRRPLVALVEAMLLSTRRRGKMLYEQSRVEEYACKCLAALFRNGAAVARSEDERDLAVAAGEAGFSRLAFMFKTYAIMEASRCVDVLCRADLIPRFLRSEVLSCF